MIICLKKRESIFLLFLLMMASGCLSHTKQSNYPPLFYQELQDSVARFVRETPPLDNHSNLPTFTQVIFDYNDGDTLVIIRPALSPQSNDRDHVIGANMLEGRICEVIYGVYGSFDHLPGIVNEDILTIPQKEYDTKNRPSSSKRQLEECDYKTVLQLSRISRVYVLNRPNHLKKIAENGMSISE